MRFTRFEEHLNCFLKLHSHILVLWLFSRISAISQFSVLGTGRKTKTQIPRKIFIFQSFLLKLYQIHFCICLSLFLLAEFVIPLLTAFSVISVVSGISELTWPLREKGPNVDIFWYVFSCIWTEYRHLLCKPPYSVQIQQNRNQNRLH